jgi:hypothetical protein
MIDAYGSIGYIPSLILRDLRVGDTKYRVGPLFAVADALRQSSYFIGKGIRPIVLVFWALDKVPILHRGSRVGVDDGACPMFGVGCNFRLECSIDIFVMVVGEHRGDEIGGVCSLGMRCLLGYRGSSSIRVGDTLGDLRRGSGVATLGGGWVGSRLIRVRFLGGPVGSGSMT